MASNKNKNVSEAKEGDEDLKEFQSSYGDPSAVEEPVKGQTPTRRADKRQGEMKPIMQGSSKAAKTAAVLNKLKEMEADEIDDLLDALEEMAGGEEKPVTQDNSDLNTPGQKGRKYKKTGVESKMNVEQVTVEDVDLADDIKAIFENDEDLSEEFKNKASVMFEAAVVSKINEQLEKLATDYDANFEVRIEEQIEVMENKMSDYLDYVVDQWMAENELAIENGIKSEISEGLLTGLKQLFDDHYIEVPEGKVDVVEELANTCDAIHEDLSAQIDQNIELQALVEAAYRKDIVDDVASGLSVSQKEKLASLSEGVKFDDEDQFKEDLFQISENYFGGKKEEDDDADTNLSTTTYMISDDMEETDDLNEEVKEIPANMRKYAASLSAGMRLKNL